MPRVNSSLLEAIKDYHLGRQGKPKEKIAILVFRVTRLSRRQIARSFTALESQWKINPDMFFRNRLKADDRVFSDEEKQRFMPLLAAHNRGSRKNWQIKGKQPPLSSEHLEYFLCQAEHFLVAPRSTFSQSKGEAISKYRNRILPPADWAKLERGIQLLMQGKLTEFIEMAANRDYSEIVNHKQLLWNANQLEIPIFFIFSDGDDLPHSAFGSLAKAKALHTSAKNAFKDTALKTDLHALNIQRLVAIGYPTDPCMEKTLTGAIDQHESNTAGALQREYKVMVCEDLFAYTPDWKSKVEFYTQF